MLSTQPHRAFISTKKVIINANTSCHVQLWKCSHKVFPCLQLFLCLLVLDPDEIIMYMYIQTISSFLWRHTSLHKLNCQNYTNSFLFFFSVFGRKVPKPKTVIPPLSTHLLWSWDIFATRMNNNWLINSWQINHKYL